MLVLASPIDIETAAAEPADDYSLLLVIGGVTDAIVVSMTAEALPRSAPAKCSG